MSPSGFQRLGFVRVSGIRGEKRVTLARFTCTRCEATHDEVIMPNRAVNPEAIAKRAERAGWRVDFRRASATLCPTCLGRKAERERPAKEAAMSAKTELRDPTPDERMRIRSLLDKHFDDSVGCYLDGYSDQRVGEETSTPWAIVTKIREAAYGPIRVDPEVAALRTEIANLGARLNGLAAEHAKLAAEQQELLARLDARAQRRSA